MSEVEPEACNCSALRQAARRVTRLYDDALAPTGLGANQYSILARLRDVGPHTIQDLARLLVMDRSTLGHLLRPLEKRGLVKVRVSD
jgi:DNA-binding MarR family transcriptional regulator